MLTRRTLIVALAASAAAPAARRRLSDTPDPDDRAVHARIAGRCGGAAPGAASVDPAQAERRGGEPPGRRHHHRHEGRLARRAGRLHAAVPELEPRRRAGDVQEPRLRPAEELRAGRQRRLGLVGDRGAAVAAGAFAAGADRLRQGASRHVEFRLRPGHRAAARRRVVQQDQRPADRQRALQGRHAGDHRHARRHHPAQHRHQLDAAAADPRGKNPRHRAMGQAAARPICRTCRP